MKLLITGYSMTYMSGQPLYCYTLAMELSKHHKVTLVSNYTGGLTDCANDIMRHNLEMSGVECIRVCSVRVRLVRHGVSLGDRAVSK